MYTYRSIDFPSIIVLITADISIIGSKIELPQIAMGLKTRPSFLSYPGKIHCNTTGQLFISDTSHHRIVVVDELTCEVQVRFNASMQTLV